MDHDFYCLHTELCKTLANEKRQMILDALRHGELSVSQLTERTGIPQANLSQHLSLMRTRGVVVARRDGSRIYYAIADAKLIQAFDLITEVMRDTLERRARAADDAGDPDAVGVDSASRKRSPGSPDRP